MGRRASDAGAEVIPPPGRSRVARGRLAERPVDRARRAANPDDANGEPL